MTTPQGTAAPANFSARGDMGPAGFRAATVCRNGHEQSVTEEEYPGDDLGFCPCSEKVLAACPSCGRRLRGLDRGRTARAGSRPSPYQEHQWHACDGCGDPYPWAERDVRISYLLRVLRDHNLDPQDRLVLTDDLLRLRALDLGEDPETEGRVMAAHKRGWFGKLAPAVVAEALGGLISEGVLRQFN